MTHPTERPSGGLAHGDQKANTISSFLCLPGAALSRSPTPRDSGTRVNVQAETLYEAVALAVRAFWEHDCAPGPASTMEVEARSPAVIHTVPMSKVPDWLNGGAKSPREKLVKERLKGLLAS
jgi:hypothetical protein